MSYSLGQVDFEKTGQKKERIIIVVMVRTGMGRSRPNGRATKQFCVNLQSNGT